MNQAYVESLELIRKTWNCFLDTIDMAIDKNVDVSYLKDSGLFDQVWELIDASIDRMYRLGYMHGEIASNCPPIKAFIDSRKNHLL